MCEKASCQQCGREMNKFQSVFKKGKEYFKKDLRKFCSLDCVGLHKRKRENIICPHCKQEFEKLSCQNILFCSKQCYYTFSKNNQQKVKSTPTPQYYKLKPKKPKLEINCRHCSKLFFKTGTNIYCSTDCKRIGGHKAWSDSRIKRALYRKAELIKLSGGGCVTCGYNKCNRAMTFHHIDPSTKKFTLDQSTLYKKNWESILLEFKKCQLLCQNCHAIHHQQERSLLEQTSKKDRYAKIKTELLNRFSWTCEICDKKFEYSQALTFHHKDKNLKLFDINIVGYIGKTPKEIEDEVSKCQCLCFNCHMEVEHELND